MRICFDRLCFATRRPAGDEDQLPQLQDITPINNHQDISTIPYYKNSINALDPPRQREYYRCTSAIESISVGSINNNVSTAITTPPVTNFTNIVANVGKSEGANNIHENKSDKSVIVNGSNVVADAESVNSTATTNVAVSEVSELTNSNTDTDSPSKMQQEPNLNIQMQPDLHIINDNVPPGVLPPNLLLNPQSPLISSDPQTINFLQQQQLYQQELGAHLLRAQQMYPPLQQQTRLQQLPPQQQQMQQQLQSLPFNQQPQVQQEPQSPAQQSTLQPNLQTQPQSPQELQPQLVLQRQSQSDGQQQLPQQVPQEDGQVKSTAPPPGFDQQPHQQQEQQLSQQQQLQQQQLQQQQLQQQRQFQQQHLQQLQQQQFQQQQLQQHQLQQQQLLTNDFSKNFRSLSNQMQNLSLSDQPNMNAMVVNNSYMPLTPKDQHYLQVINIRDLQIQELQKTLRAKENEIAELKSHLDKFQSVFPFSRSPGPAATPSAVPGMPGARKSGHVFPRQRAQGISAEPQSESSVLELLHVTFPKYDKEERKALSSYWQRENFLFNIIKWFSSFSHQ
ncbi:unnamed protein product [Hermetia illucens]|uniref:Uncharacterized protein n=1 Tax=Hermetia illucens TaxID=343691 RepID=A0A7R8UE73_HERIL|nr:unnamed protein product [Hermetia illucens]